jgi:protein subunit release factor B
MKEKEKDKDKDKELIFIVQKKDFEVQTFQSGGKGGQHQNKTDSGVRIIHRDSSAVGESRTDRSQLRNKRLAFKRLTDSNKFKLWMQRRVFEITGGKTIAQRVDEQMQSKNIKVEVKDETTNRWKEEEIGLSK